MPDGFLLPTILGYGTGGAGIALGGLAACLVATRFTNITKFAFAGTSGMILSLLIFELMPESIKIGGLLYTLVGVLVGLTIIRFIEDKFHKISIITGNRQHSMFIRTSILLAIGIAIHNLPVGFTIGVGFVNQPQASLDLATIMLFHNFPEGLAMSLPLVLSNLNKTIIPLGAAIVAFPAGLGSWLGFSLGTLSPFLIALFFGASVGTIFYVTWHEILKPARKQMRWTSLLACVAIGGALGKLLIYFLE